MTTCGGAQPEIRRKTDADLPRSWQTQNSVTHLRPTHPSIVPNQAAQVKEG